jgi:hypothetical protein
MIDAIQTIRGILPQVFATLLVAALFTVSHIFRSRYSK